MARFRAQVGTTFTVLAPMGSLDFTLVAVNDLGHAIKQPVARGESFNCHFGLTRPVDLPQDIYQMKHPVLGTFSIFMVPAAGLDPGTGASQPAQYVASFNRV